MNFPKLFPVLLALAAGLGGGWWLHASSPAPISGAAAERRPLYYQSPMHPWVKSDRPGKCTICGMDLVPVFADTAPATAGDATAPNLIVLSAARPP